MFPCDNEELLALALSYACDGWHVFPCHTIRDGECTCGTTGCKRIAKHPWTLHGCRDATTDLEVIRRWWAAMPDANVAIATGPASNLWVVDLDGLPGMEALADLERIHGPLPNTISVATPSGGRHLYFSWPEGASIGCRVKVQGVPIDVRGAGGYVVAPPSWHFLGQCYRWETCKTLATAPSWLLEWLKPPAGNLEYLAPPPAPDMTSLLAKRIRAYLAECPIAVSGQAGHNTTFAVVCRVVQGFNLTEEQALPFLMEWNERCVPPWSEREMRHKVQDAIKAPGERGRLLHDVLHDVPFSDFAFSTVRQTGVSDSENSQNPRENEGSVGLSDCRTQEVCKTHMSPYVPFPVEALPDIAREFVIEGARTLGCDPAYVALPVLTVLAGCIGNTRRIRLKRKWSEPAVLWTVIVSPSGTMKSPAIELAMEEIYRIQMRKVQEFQRALMEYRVHYREFEKALSQWKRKKDDSLPPSELEAPRCPRLVVSDITVERLGQLLQQNPRGLLVCRDELAGWVTGFNQYKSRGGSDVANWLELHRCGTLIVDRKNLSQPIVIPRASVSIAGGIQPRTLARVLTAQLHECGLAARLLTAMPPRQPKRWNDVELSGSIEQKYKQLIERLLSLDFVTNTDGEPEPKDVLLGPEAKIMWSTFVNEWNMEQMVVHEELSAAFSKLEGYAARFTLIHHLATYPDIDCMEVQEDSIQAGITLSRWFANEAERVHAMIGMTPDERSTQQLADLIRAKGGSITPRDLQRSNGRRYRTVEESIQALDNLVTAGIGSWVTVNEKVKGRFDLK